MKSDRQTVQLIFALFLSGSLSILTGCVPIASGVIAYNAAISHQDSVAYADYFFAMQAKNKASQEAGRPEQPILSEERWLKEIQQPRLEYVEYYSWSTEHGVSPGALVPFESWNENERQKFRAAQREELEKANPMGKKGGTVIRN
jgi:hypothetical protein